MFIYKFIGKKFIYNDILIYYEWIFDFNLYKLLIKLLLIF